MYQRGENLSAALRKDADNGRNTEAIIEWSYDLQAGSYIQALQDPGHSACMQGYTSEVARLLTSLGPARTILEAGVGEATTLGNVARKLGQSEATYHGFDLSWSRIAFARRWLQDSGMPPISLYVASLLQMPYANDSIDIVYTSHSVEPNGGQEEMILRELYRVTRRYLVLLEPDYDLAGEEARRHMDAHGYCRNLPGVALGLGYRVIEHKLFPCTTNPLNPTALTVIEKHVTTPAPPDPLVCPRFKTPLRKAAGMFFSPEALTVYPVVGGIPCLRPENSIIASHYLQFCGEESP